MTHFIDGKWIEGRGVPFSSINPSNLSTVWEGKEATKKEVEAAVEAAQAALPSWRSTRVEERYAYLERFQKLLATSRLPEIIGQEMGKALWEAEMEVSIMEQKIPATYHFFQERRATQIHNELKTAYKPLGPIAIFGPFNFPGHIPHAQIVPALLAGNTIILKNSEQTPYVAETMTRLWEKAGLPRGVLNCIQGGAKTGEYLARAQGIKALFFTGSYNVGKKLASYLATTPEKLLALELGGNNPLLVADIDDPQDAAYLALQSAYLTSGQRCTCARRLIVVEKSMNRNFLDLFINMARSIEVGDWNAIPSPFMGPVASLQSVETLLEQQEQLINIGGMPLLKMEQCSKGCHLTPGLIDMTGCPQGDDKEAFGPLVQLIRVPSVEEGIAEANKTEYGLSASILTRDEALFNRFWNEVEAGCINWNQPTCAASGALPFGGVGTSGNHRPCGAHTIDLCNDPIATKMSPSVAKIPEKTLGIGYFHA